MATYDVRLMDGTRFTDVADHTMFQMLEQLNVQDVASRETGEILYQSKAAKEEERISHMSFEELLNSEGPELIVKVNGITRAITTVHGVKQYNTAIVIPMPREWQVITRADIPTQAFYTMFEQYATKRFDRALSSMWGHVPFYNEVRLYHNGILVRAGVEGKEITI